MFATVLVAASPLVAADRVDLAKLDELRSLLAEAVAVDAGEAHRQVTPLYATAVRADIRQDIGKLADDPTLGPAAREALEALRRRDTAALARGRDRLVVLERAHGRAD
jgi:hypothetical protein